MAMSVAGSIALTLQWDGHVVRRAGVASSRPLPSRLLPGRSPAEAEAMIALLFGVCGRAQTVAAAQAIEAARGLEVAREIQLQREAALLAEVLYELSWRILIDLPALAGEAPQPERLAALRAELQVLPGQGRPLPGWWHVAADESARRAWGEAAGRIERLLARHIFAAAPSDWLEMASMASVAAWVGIAPTPAARYVGKVWGDPLGRCSTPLLPRLSAAQAVAALPAGTLLEEHFAGAPTWQGTPAETGVLARTAAHPLIADALAGQGNTVATRLLARLVELALLPARLARLAAGQIGTPWAGRHSPAPASGVSTTETARGVLLHQVELDGERIGRYGIVAPTEWNFHPEGAFAQGLAGLAAASSAAAAHAAEWLAHSLDPCVACRIEVIHA